MVICYNINKSIKDDKIDYVVMGTEGASGWSEFFSGTHTGNVLQMWRSDTQSMQNTRKRKP
jgi:hypothetical protein